jgi:hypothetical protein
LTAIAFYKKGRGQEALKLEGRRKRNASRGLKAHEKRKKFDKKDDYRVFYQTTIANPTFFQRGNLLPPAFYLLPLENCL